MVEVTSIQRWRPHAAYSVLLISIYKMALIQASSSAPPSTLQPANSHSYSEKRRSLLFNKLKRFLLQFISFSIATVSVDFLSRQGYIEHESVKSLGWCASYKNGPGPLKLTCRHNNAIFLNLTGDLSPSYI